MRVTFPFWGNYTIAFEKLAKRLGFEVVSPQITSPKTIEEGVKISPEMYCFPLKVNIGNFLEAIKRGADTIVMPTAQKGSCRLRYYPFVQEKILKEQEKEVEFIVFDQSLKNIYRKIKELTNFSFLKISEILLFFFLFLKTIDDIERKSWFLRPREIKKGETDNFLSEAFSQLMKVESTKELLKVKKEILEKFKKIKYKEIEVPKVGIVGEIFTVCDFAINFQIEKKLGKLGIEVHRDLTLLYHLKKRIFPWIDLKVALGAKKYLKSAVGGHGREAVYEMLYYAKKGFDGAIQLLPAMCVPGDTNITVENYLQKPIKEIKVGEKVLTHKGRFKKVIKVFRRNYQGKMLKIDCGGKLLTLYITPEHKILLAPAKLNSNNCVKKIGELKFTPALKAKKGDFLAIPIPNEVKNKEFLEWNKEYNRKPKWEDIKKFPYSADLLRMLGYWLAEGSIKYDKNDFNPQKRYKRAIVFAFSTKETKYINDVVKIIKNNFNARISLYRKPTTLYLEVGNRNLSDIVHYLCGSYCDKKVMHSDLVSLKPEFQKEILKGFFRGDGNFRDKYGETTYRAVTTSFQLASQMFWLLIRNRIKPSFLQQNIKNRKPSWVIKISNANGIKRLDDEMIKVTDRINNVRFRELPNYFLVPIRKIEVIDFDGPVYNLAVEDDHSYVANFLAVKNCMPETSVRPILEKIHQDTGIPFLSLSIDEQTGEAGIETRLEAFSDVVFNYFSKKKTKRK